jgi:hypothetical protein
MSARYQLCAPVIFRWTDSNGLDQQDSGFTHDISTAGIFVSCHAPPSPETGEIRLEIALPPLEPAAHGVRLQAKGSIVRVEQTEQRTGFAAKVILAGFPIGRQ